MFKEQATESIPIHRKSVDVAVLVALTTDVMERQARALGIAMTVLIDENVPDTASLDRDKVAWAITSLVGSALRHARKPGGSVVVQVAYDPARWALCISVRDDGPGIPPDRLARLLDRTPWHPGGALALLLVEDIARAHGGTMKIESRTDGSNHFTAVSLTIPLHPDRESSSVEVRW
jgi:signal transduction histidine kinase